MGQGQARAQNEDEEIKIKRVKNEEVGTSGGNKLTFWKGHQASDLEAPLLDRPRSEQVQTGLTKMEKKTARVHLDSCELQKFACYHYFMVVLQWALLAVSIQYGYHIVTLAVTASLLIATCICCYAALRCGAPDPLYGKDSPLPLINGQNCNIFGLLTYGIFQWIVLVQAFVRNSGTGEGYFRRFHFKAMIAILEGLLISTSVLYTHWVCESDAYHKGQCTNFDDEAPLSVKYFIIFCGWIEFIHASFGLVEHDVSCSHTIRKRFAGSMEAGSDSPLHLYQYKHWFFRSCEVISRVSILVFFAMLAELYRKEFWGVIFADWIYSAIAITLFTGPRNTRLAIIGVSLRNTVANTFLFVDEPEHFRATRLVSRCMTFKHLVEFFAVAILLCSYADVRYDITAHPSSVPSAIICSILFLIGLFWWVRGRRFGDSKYSLFKVVSSTPLLGGAKRSTEASEAEYEAAKYEKLKKIALEKEETWEVNTYDEFGWTPLMYAARDGQKEVVKMLLADGADKSLKAADDRGHSAWARCIRQCMFWYWGYNYTAFEIARDKDIKELVDPQRGTESADQPNATHGGSEISPRVPVGSASFIQMHSLGLLGALFEPDVIDQRISKVPPRSLRVSPCSSAKVQAEDTRGRPLTGEFLITHADTYLWSAQGWDGKKSWQLGEGKFGRVWRGMTRNKELRAVKVMTNEGKAKHTNRQDLLVAYAVMNAPHPSLINMFALYNFDKSGGNKSSYLAVEMELCEMGSLQDMVEESLKVGKKYREHPDARLCCQDVFSGLEHVHKKLRIGTRNGLVRDLKPLNVGVTANHPDGRHHAKILDMGNFSLEAWEFGFFRSGAPPASPGYVSPEMIRAWTYDYKTDIYSFGALVWVLLTGGEGGGVPSNFNGRDIRSCYNDYEILNEEIDCNPASKLRDEPCKTYAPLKNFEKNFLSNCTNFWPENRPDHSEVNRFLKRFMGETAPKADDPGTGSQAAI